MVPETPLVSVQVLKGEADVWVDLQFGTKLFSQSLERMGKICMTTSEHSNHHIILVSSFEGTVLSELGCLETNFASLQRQVPQLSWW